LVKSCHQRRRVFATEDPDAVPKVFEPYDPHGYLRQLHHIHGDYKGQRAPEDPSYCAAAVHLSESLKQHDPELAARQIGMLHLDVEAETDRELLAAARSSLSA
jgi:hypothetical protein